MTNEVTITKKYEVDDDFIGNVLVTAFDGNYGACYYWALPEDAEDMQFLRVVKDETDPEPLPMGRWAAVELTKVYHSDDEDFPQTPEDAKTCIHHTQVWFGHECGLCMDDNGRFVWLVTVDKAMVLKGIGIVLETFPDNDVRRALVRSVEENDAGDVDAEVADCIVQCGLFGELVYS